MEADIFEKYESDFYRVLDFKCRCTSCTTSKPEYSHTFSISFVRKGNFLFNVFRNSLDSYTGCVLISKQGYERTVKHTHSVPDECTIFEFKQDFYENLLENYPHIKFLFDNDLHATLVKINPETEYLHFQIVRLVLTGEGSKLEIDNLVMELVETVFGKITNYRANHKVTDRLKKNHLVTIEKAKDFMTRHFTRDISLMELSEHCCVSPFHFSRLFKTITNYSPHQFLLTIRLKNSEMLLRTTSLPVTDVAFFSGFNSIEHFSAAFRNKYQYSPVKFREVIGVA